MRGVDVKTTQSLTFQTYPCPRSGAVSTRRAPRTTRERSSSPPLSRSQARCRQRQAVGLQIPRGPSDSPMPRRNGPEHCRVGKLAGPYWRHQARWMSAGSPTKLRVPASVESFSQSRLQSFASNRDQRANTGIECPRINGLGAGLRQRMQSHLPPDALTQSGERPSAYADLGEPPTSTETVPFPCPFAATRVPWLLSEPCSLWVRGRNAIA
jgi:hypothetical protein